MGFLGYGSAKAASYEHDFDKDIDRLYQREAYRARITAEKERKAAYYAELMKEHNAVSPAINRQLEEHYKTLNNQIADFAINNPGFETDVNLSQQFNAMTDGYLNNDLVRKDKQSQAEFEKLKAASASGDMTQAEYDSNMERYDEWLQTGQDPYTFTNIQKFSLFDAVKIANDQLESQTIITSDGRRITKTVETDLEDIGMTASSQYRNNPEVKRVVDADWATIPDEYKSLYKTPVGYYAKMIENGEPFTKDDHAYDEFWLLKQRAALSGEPTGEDAIPIHYLQDVYQPYIENGEVSPNPNNIYFTEFASPNGRITNSASGRNFHYRNKDGALTDFTLYGDIQASKMGAVRIFSAKPGDQTGGSAMAEIPVNIMTNATDHNLVISDKGRIYRGGDQVGIDELSEKERSLIQLNEETGLYEWLIPQEYKDQLIEAGFEKKKITIPGSLEFGFEDQVIQADAWVGTIVAPANFSITSRKGYEESKLTAKEFSTATAAGTYSEASDLNLLASAASQGDRRAAELAEGRIFRTGSANYTYKSGEPTSLPKGMKWTPTPGGAGWSAKKTINAFEYTFVFNSSTGQSWIAGKKDVVGS
jgi:hypothetical protein